jgi:YHS domain-containing protein
MPSRRNPLLITAATLVASLAAVLLIASSALAGEYFEKDGVALRGHDPVAYFSAGKPVKGTGEHRAEHRGSVFHFASKANLDAFKAEPQRYAAAKTTKVHE